MTTTVKYKNFENVIKTKSELTNLFVKKTTLSVADFWIYVLDAKPRHFNDSILQLIRKFTKTWLISSSRNTPV